MSGQENVPVINDVALANMLGLDVPYIFVLGKPPKKSKSVREKKFGKRIQKTKS